MNETRTILDQSVSRLFADELDWDAQTRIEQEGWPHALWQQVCEQGIERVLAAEDAGGMAAAWGDAYPVLRACGRYGVPLPVAEAILCHWLARQAGIVLPEGVPGLIAAPVELENNRLLVTDTDVPWGRNADYFVATADANLVIASIDGATVSETDNIGRDPRDKLNGRCTVLSKAALNAPADSIHWLGALVRSAQIAGAGAAALDLAVNYTGEREQFGRPLSRFQAIQHHLADLAGIVASVDAMAMAACEAVDRRGFAGNGRDARLEIAAAKQRASEGVEKITRLSHQVHGAIGFTYEYGLHFLTRRLWAWRSEFGTAAAWGEYLGRAALEQGGNGVWPLMTD